jgi:L-threonylcarbamoyladenylate synthase
MEFEKDIEQCLMVLKQGGLILYPTDTVWGIGCDATNREAVEKIYRLKQRSDSKAMIVLLADERDILKHVAHPDPRVFDYLATTTKPTTVVFDGALGFADNLVASDGSIGIRLCHEPFCRALIKRLRKPLVSTSANISGEKTAPTFPDITSAIRQGVDYIVHYRQDDTTIASPSSVVRWNRDSTVTVLRP